VHNIYSLTKENLAKELKIISEKPFRANQIWNWLYHFGVRDFDQMTNISKSSSIKLKDQFCFDLPIAKNITKSIDGTIKFLVEFIDKNQVEAVYIPEKSRATLCISSQIGCTLACKFCHTGTQMLVRNLDFHEIIAQIIIAKDIINDWGNKKLTNIVFMGMGEPFFNYENVRQAVNIMCDSNGLNFSKKKVTISTSGLVNEIAKAKDEIGTNLAISLHATNDKVRTDIMAINKKYPIDELFKICKKYSETLKQKITFEYVMLENINDHAINANELIALIKKHNINCKINLIPFNKWQGCNYQVSNMNKIIEFQKILQKNHIVTTIRKTRGDDNMAACGQLKSESQRKAKIFKNK
tara:strand:+ start:274 stop:1335 length:1062 start_codon:yes stop_codon:yes gene_type:complete